MLTFKRAIAAAKACSLQNPEPMKRFQNLAKEARLLVFERSLFFDALIKTNESNLLPDDAEIDLPFETCWFESLYNIFEGDQLAELSAVYPVEWTGLLVHEVQPRVHQAFVFGLALKRDGSGEVEEIIHEIPPGQADQKLMKTILEHTLKRISSGIIGTESVREKIKIGTGYGKEFLRIKDLIRVVPKKDQFLVKPINGDSIDWSHRWEVRGHWRKTKYIGKDRTGHYCVKGFTWVNKHSKGPDDKPLVRKTRLVIEQRHIPS